MIRYFFGEDILTARERITALAHTLHAQLRFVDETDILEASIEGLVDGSKGGLFGLSLLVFRDPLSYPEPIREQLLEYLSSSSDSANTVFWERGNPDAKSSLHKLLKKSANVEQFPQIADMQQGMRWIAAYIADHAEAGATMEKDAMTLLLQKVGFDTFALASELQKLLVYHTPISTQDVETIVPERAGQAGSAFPLLDAISVKNSKAAIALLTAMIAGGASERFILSMIAYQYRLLLAVRMGIDQHLDSMHISKASKLHPIAVQKTFPIARRLSLSAIQEALLRVAGTERSMNTNKTMDERSIVTMLVNSLTA